MSHGDSVGEVPPGFAPIARSDIRRARRDGRRRMGASASSSTPRCATRRRAPRCWRTSSSASAAARPPGRPARSSRRRSSASARRWATGRVICGLSGGVDSAVAALLVHRAIGDRLTCIFVDTGCLRAGEPEQVVETFRAHLRIPLVAVDARERFLDATGRRDRPRAEAAHHRRGVRSRLRGRGGEAEPRGRGRLPGAGHALSRRDRERQPAMPAARAEDQDAPQRRRPARSICASSWSSRCATSSRTRCARSARELGLPEDWVWRHPFPGPGLAVRVHRRGDAASGWTTLRAGRSPS